MYANADYLSPNEGQHSCIVVSEDCFEGRLDMIERGSNRLVFTVRNMFFFLR